ncbi:MAG: 6-phosphofructokinase, partial [Gemmatimonadota bacterium]
MGKGTIAILTGGGDVPGLNPAIRAITIRALRDGYNVVGIRRGWAGLVDYVPDAKVDNSESVQPLTEAIVNRAGRTGGTFLHTSRVRPSHLPRERLPAHLTGYAEPVNDVTRDVLRNLE